MTINFEEPSIEEIRAIADKAAAEIQVRTTKELDEKIHEILSLLADMAELIEKAGGDTSIEISHYGDTLESCTNLFELLDSNIFFCGNN